MDLNEFIKKVKDKRTLRSLDNEFVLKIVKNYIKIGDLNKLNKKDSKLLLKKVRTKLHEIHGAFFSIRYSKVKSLLKRLNSLADIETHKSLLKLHKSTKERLPYYEEVYEKIFKTTGKPKILLDLGSGLNPISLPFMKIKPDKYYAIELKMDDAKLLNEYFSKIKVEGEAVVMDLTDSSIKLPAADVCFMFKLLDSLETVKLNITKPLLEKIKARWIVVSFATRSLGGKKTIKERKWFEQLIKNFQHKKFYIPNEVFYIIKKH